MLRDGKHWRREERVQSNAHRHVKRNEMDTEGHRRKILSAVRTTY
jgi:hypothetical protein